MKKKIVVKVAMNDDKSRSKALKISVGISGVESAALSGSKKDQVVVVGEDIDAVELMRQLRKHVGRTELVSVGDDKKEEKATAKPAETVFGFTRRRITDLIVSQFGGVKTLPAPSRSQ